MLLYCGSHRPQRRRDWMAFVAATLVLCFASRVLYTEMVPSRQDGHGPDTDILLASDDLENPMTE